MHEGAATQPLFLALKDPADRKNELLSHKTVANLAINSLFGPLVRLEVRMFVDRQDIADHALSIQANDHTNTVFVGSGCTSAEPGLSYLDLNGEIGAGDSFDVGRNRIARLLGAVHFQIESIDTDGYVNPFQMHFFGGNDYDPSKPWFRSLTRGLAFTGAQILLA